MRARIAVELAVVVALLAIAGFVWLMPASTDLIGGHAERMIGDATDSVTNVWQYQMILDTLHRAPWRLLFGALYSDQTINPDATAVFIPYSERIIVLLLAPFMRVELMPTAVVWMYIVLSGVCMHACGRLLGWSRTVSFALALAWAICPHTRARAECHIALVGVYFAPLAIAGVRILAGAPAALGWSKRKELVVGSLALLCAAMAAHYYLMLLVGFAPLFILLYALLLPRGASRLDATKRLAIAALPALALVLSTGLMPLPPAETRAVNAAAVPADAVRKENELALKIYGAHGLDFVAGDLRFGDRDVIPARAAISRTIRETAKYNLHERTNGIRWTLLASVVVLGGILCWRRLRRRLRREDRRLAAFAFVLGIAALAVAVGPTGIRHHDIDIGPAELLARVLPTFRVANRAGVLAHLAALLATGIVLSMISANVARRGRSSIVLREIPGVVLFALVVVEYLPLHPVEVAPVAMARRDLPRADGVCGAGVTVPYVTYTFQVDHYYATIAELRGTSCKIVHLPYLAPVDEKLRDKLSMRTFDAGDLERSVQFARCARASWAIFRMGAPEEFKQSFCSQLGWSFTGPDSCRTDPKSTAPLPEARHASECVP